MTEKVNIRGVVKSCYKLMGKAISDYDMLHDGDKVLVAVSGGEDSLSLLNLFLLRQKKIKINFEVIACHVDTSFVKLDRKTLLDHFESLGIDYTIKELELDDDGMNCFWCSWNRRKVLFETAKELGVNKIALGHHLDDIAETTLMNLFYRGEISTSPPAVDFFDGELKVIRPLCYIEKKDLAEFARELNLPVTSYECLYGKDSRRIHSRKIIEDIEQRCPYVKKNIFKALGRIKQEYLT